TVPAFAHRKIALELAKYLKRDQIVAINSGSILSSLEFTSILKEMNTEINCTVVELSNIRGCRKSSNGIVNIHGMRNEISVAGQTKEEVTKAVSVLKKWFPKVRESVSLMEMALNNHS